MVSRPLIISLLLAAGGPAASSAAAASPSRNLRASNPAAVPAAAEDAGDSSEDVVPDIADERRRSLQGGSSEDVVPDIADERRSLQGGSSEDIVPDVADARRRGRRLQEDDEDDETEAEDKPDTNTTTKALVTSTVKISRKCLAGLQATVNENQQLRKEGYFLFSDIMSNGGFSFSNMTDYSDLPMGNKFAYVTLTCQCTQMGGRGNCCQGNRARIDMRGIDEPATMPEQMQRYVADVCATTVDAIPEDYMRPPTGEFPTTEEPTVSPPPTGSSAPSGSPTSSAAPTDSPSDSAWPTMSFGPSGAPSAVPTASPTVSVPPTAPSEVVPPIEKPVGGGGSGGGGGGDDSLSPGAWAGIAIAGAAVLTLFIFLLSRSSTEHREDDDDANADRDLDDDAVSAQGARKELRAITNGDLIADAAPRQDSPDATNSMTASDVSSIPSMGTSGSKGRGAKSSYYANNSLLPGRPDEESVISSSDGPSFFTDESTIAEEGVEVSPVSSPRGLAAKDSLKTNLMNTSDNSGGESLDEAIESGNWEAVAASAAAIVKNNEPVQSVVHHRG